MHGLVGDYNVIITTGNERDAGTESLITLSMCGTSGTTVSTDLPNMRNVFEPGNTDEFPVRYEQKFNCLYTDPAPLLTPPPPPHDKTNFSELGSNHGAKHAREMMQLN